MRLFAAALRPEEGDEPGGGDDVAEATGGTDPVVLDATGGAYPVAEDAADVDGTKTDINCETPMMKRLPTAFSSGGGPVSMRLKSIMRTLPLSSVSGNATSGGRQCRCWN